MIKKNKINQRVIRRISYYYEALLKDSLPEDVYISSAKIEAITGISNNQIRQDLFYLGLSIGKQKKGYIKGDMIRELKGILNIHKGADLIVIGAGKLGRALASYKIFSARNIRIKAFFDIKDELIGKEYQIDNTHIPIYHIDDIDEFVSKNSPIDVALLTVSEDATDMVFEKVVAAGIKGVVNYTPRILQKPPGKENEDIKIINDCLAISLYHIIYQLY